MVNLKNRRCQHQGCTLIPTFGYNYTKTPKYCLAYKTSSMEDLQHKKCEIPGCKLRPSFGTTKALYCNAHKQKSDVNINSMTPACLSNKF